MPSSEEARVAPGLDAIHIDRTARGGARRSRKRRLVLLLAIAVAAIVTGVAIALTRPPAVAVAEVREARPGEAATELSAAGYVVSRRRSIVAPQVPGRLVEVLVNEGEEVRAGQVLARLDDQDARAALEEARARAASTRARLEAARATTIKAERDLRRAEQLEAVGAIAAVELSDARTTQLAAEAETRAAGAELAAAGAAIAVAELQIEHAEIRAPFDGTVVRKIADEGAVLAPAAISEIDVGGVVEMVDLDALEVEAEVGEEELARIRDGQPALIFLDAYPDAVHRGEVVAVRPSIDRAKATAVIKVRFSDRPNRRTAGAATVRVLPNMGARVSFLSQPLDPQALAHEPRLRVPASAVVERNGAHVVFVIEGGRARSAPVEVAGRAGGEVLLRAGPPPGAKVVAAPRARLREGSRVRVRATEAAS
jgi:RND family efflux transporter MFP subunit